MVGLLEDSDFDKLGPGSKVGRYEIVEVLGNGGMARVFGAWDPELGRQVAIKMLHGPWDPYSRSLFRHEMKATARLVHPSTVRVFDLGEVHGWPYCVLEWVQGPTIEQALSTGLLTRESAIRALQQAAEAVAHAHARGVLHRDIKPRNLLIAPGRRPVVIDFGLARIRDEQDASSGTAGMLVGTPAYMSPEQARGESERIDERTDVWGLGATLYEILTGRPPFSGDSLDGIFARVLKDPPLPPRMFDGTIHPDVESICLKALEKDPDRRYDSVGELAQELARYLRGEPVVVRPRGRLSKLWRTLSGIGPTIRVAVASALVTAAALGLYQWATSRIPAVQAGRAARAIEGGISPAGRYP